MYKSIKGDGYLYIPESKWLRKKLRLEIFHYVTHRIMPPSSGDDTMITYRRSKSGLFAISRYRRYAIRRMSRNSYHPGRYETMNDRRFYGDMPKKFFP